MTPPTINSFGLKSTEISAKLMLKSARRMANVALVLVLTTLYGINQSLGMHPLQVNRQVEGPMN
jgi:hypothetical protein